MPQLALIVFLVPATALYHNLFLFKGKDRDPHLYLTLVNITLAGGLLMVMPGTRCRGDRLVQLGQSQPEAERIMDTFRCIDRRRAIARRRMSS